MAWREVKVEDQRLKFINAYLEGNYSVAELCRYFDISRKTAYKWLSRYQQDGMEGLHNRSKAPLYQAAATHPDLVKKILSIRFRFPTWGPKKVRGFLVNHNPSVVWPSTTTIGNLFDKHGLAEPRKLRKRLAERTDPFTDCNQSNDIWCFDFKGWSLTQDLYKCDPFTITDEHSRYLLCCSKLIENDAEHVWAVFDRLFRDYGRPLKVRSDNGPPFATTGAGRLSSLSVKLIKAGVLPEWIDPGQPQQNGRHERMHLTLKKEGMNSSELTLEEQKIKLAEFVEYYNFVRPHEALGQKCPGSVYQPSSRLWNGRLESPEYSEDYKVGKVRSCGKMSWGCREIYIGRVLANEPIGIKLNELGQNIAYYGPIKLGILTDQLEITRRKPRFR